MVLRSNCRSNRTTNMSKFTLYGKIILTAIFSLLFADPPIVLSLPKNRSPIESDNAIELNWQAQNSDEDGCEAYANGYAVARTKQYYIAICGGKNKKDLSFYAIKTNDSPEKAEREKIQVDNVLYANGTYAARKGRNTYVLTPKFLIFRRDGRIVIKEKVVKYKVLSKLN